MNDSEADKEGAKAKKPDLLPLIREEMKRAIGFEQDEDLRASRERALNYFKGDVSQDIPSLPNRSKAVSSDLSDAVDTILPDLMEIFTGGDDVVAFIPQRKEDEEAAKQETAYLNHVVFQENPGFRNFLTAIQDALLVKIGLFTWDYEVDREDEIESFTGKNIVELQQAQADGSEVFEVKPDDETGQTFSFKAKRVIDNSSAKYYAVPPENFAVAPDTVDIAETTYCSMRDFPRVQDLIASGYDEAKVKKLPPYAGGTDDSTKKARDNAGESDNGQSLDDTSAELRQVETRKHHIRVLGEDGKLHIWCVVTDSEATIELDAYEVERINYAVGSPYLVAHRMFGRSLADLLIELMKIKTALTRAVLDSAYFALNQRVQVNMKLAGEYTISDLLRNEPGSPVRTNGEGAIAPLHAGGLSFDAYAALEHFSVAGEHRTGIMRNAQGLNPDTLHDTAKGALTLMTAAQKRTRMIARVLAETLIKPLYLGLHASIRENAKSQKITNLLGKWVPVSPTSWASRNAMTVEVGLGASGKELEMAAMEKIAALQAAIVQGQGGPMGPIVFPENIFKTATDTAKKLGLKTPEDYFSDPQSERGMQVMKAQAERPSPEMAKVQAQSQADQQKTVMDGQIKTAQLQQEGQIKAQQTQAENALAGQRMQTEFELKKYQMDNELSLKREQLAAELQLKREQLSAELAIKREIGLKQADANISSDVRPGGEPG